LLITLWIYVYVFLPQYLLKELVETGLWTPEVRNQMIAEKGSVMNIRQIPQELKDMFKTTWEIKQKVIIDMAANRGAYICQVLSATVTAIYELYSLLLMLHFYFLYSRNP
jgi:ribonucleoside-diphosphate reductase alpha chain